MTSTRLLQQQHLVDDSSCGLAEILGRAGSSFRPRQLVFLNVLYMNRLYCTFTPLSYLLRAKVNLKPH